MALPQIIKYIYNNGSDEIIPRGKKIYNNGDVEMISYDELTESVSLRIKDDSYSTWYKVRIAHFKDENKMNIECTCPNKTEEMCRHEIAALFNLQDLIDSNLLGDSEMIQYDQTYTVIRMKQIDVRMLRLLSDADSYAHAEDFLDAGNKIKIIEAKDETVKAEVKYMNDKCNVILQKNEERNFDTSCNCQSDPLHPLCVHKIITFLYLLKKSGATYFDTIRNLDKEKNKLLALYGYSTDDNLKGKFEFTIKDGKPFLRVLDTSIKRLNPTEITQTKRQETALETISKKSKDVEVEEEQISKYSVGLVLSANQQQYPYLSIDGIEGEVDEDGTEFVGKVITLDLNKYVNIERLNEVDKKLVQQMRKLLPTEINRYLNRNSPFSGIWENIVQQQSNELPDDTKMLLLEYILPKLKKLFNDSASSYFTFYCEQNNEIKEENLEVANYSINYLTPQFMINEVDDHYEIACTVRTPLGEFSVGDNEMATSILLQIENQFYLWQKPEDVLLVEKFMPSGNLFIPKEEWKDTLTNFILPLTKDYQVKFGNISKNQVENTKPTLKITLKEKGNHLLICPSFMYNNFEVLPDEKNKILVPSEGSLLEITRDIDAENELLSKIEGLHSGFIRPEQNSATLAIKGNEALKNNWFFLFLDSTREMNVPVFGMESLKKFRFNTAKPSTKIFISSHTDWFDAKVEISFGDQKVSVAEIKKALAKKQQYIQLADGTLGVLPEEWIKKYSLLFQVGEDETNQNLKLSKYHFSVIEELYEKRDEEELFFKLEEKYDKLKNNYEITDTNPPERLLPILRPYQKAGFQWLNYLKEVNWGGILADDMGLGKTLQTLSFLYHLKQEIENFQCLVICPTTLMYNWASETKKFTPDMTTFIYHGAGRNKEELKTTKANVIITTYGTIRSDIKIFSEINYDYIALDESQAIKNPSSKIAKAVALLKSTNRLCLSGTPLQNNTFDIYAQMNFLNPGLLGSIDFFKQQFAIPIDKFGEQEQKAHLKKLLFPFILRRTKEQVAKDLPEKTEMILFCEMDKEQRKIYDAYRNDYRDKILGLIETQGINKTQLTVLQGLMRLRQICDSPAILKNENFPNESVKLQEIERQIEENVGQHKTLIFSQFLGMLALIREKLTAQGIKHEYFDGSTTAEERERAIQNFQNNEECRVFLISLKAGGVGLNLTAADYVYLVDPWWNPAVEQQAIDRTHRIGQTRKIFAYRMICKDSVEDKILQLQERKKALANELISDENGFVKALSKEDIEYLFS